MFAEPLLHPGLVCNRDTEVQNLRSISSQGTKSPWRTVTFAKASVPGLDESKFLPCAELNTTDRIINSDKQYNFREKWKNLKAAAMTQNNLVNEDKNAGTREIIIKKRASVQGVDENR